MTDSVDIQGELKSGVPVISLNYGPEQMLKDGPELGQELLAKYAELESQQDRKSPSVVINIKATTAGSPLIRALVKLHTAAKGNKGRLICVGYPLDYLPSLTSLGLLNQPDFTVDDDEASAIARLQPTAA